MLDEIRYIFLFTTLMLLLIRLVLPPVDEAQSSQVRERAQYASFIAKKQLYKFMFTPNNDNNDNNNNNDTYNFKYLLTHWGLRPFY